MSLVYATDEVLLWEHLRVGACAAGAAALRALDSSDELVQEKTFTDAWIDHIRKNMPAVWPKRSYDQSQALSLDTRLAYAEYTNAGGVDDLHVRLYNQFGPNPHAVVGINGGFNGAVLRGVIERLDATQIACVDTRVSALITQFADWTIRSYEWRQFRAILHDVWRRAQTRFDVSGMAREIVRRTGETGIAGLVAQFAVHGGTIPVRRSRKERERIAAEEAALPVFAGFKRLAPPTAAAGAATAPPK
jgi:hypothetical protein